MALGQRRATMDHAGRWIEPGRELVNFSSKAAEYFRGATPAIRRLIIQTVCSNPLLTAKEFSAEARKPFRIWGTPTPVSEMCGFLKDVRTFSEEDKKGLDGLLENIRQIKASLSQSEEHDEKAA